MHPGKRRISPVDDRAALRIEEVSYVLGATSFSREQVREGSM
jgi:hypothetical protein